MRKLRLVAKREREGVQKEKVLPTNGVVTEKIEQTDLYKRKNLTSHQLDETCEVGK